MTTLSAKCAIAAATAPASDNAVTIFFSHLGDGQYRENNYSMRDTHNLERLKAHILPLSRSKHFETARAEWSLQYVEISDEVDSCPCGQTIKEHCYIQNRRTGHQTYVGNVCINRFMGIDTGSLFDGLKRIAAKPDSNANQAVIEYARKAGFLYGDKEYDFLMSTRLKKILSTAQLSWKEKINRRILSQTVVQKRTVR